jgi:hypothetical protein
MPSPKFPARPQPFRDESFPGYIIRICIANCITSLRQICDFLNISNSALNYISGTSAFNNFIEKFAPTVAMKKEEIDSIFCEDIQYFDESRLLKCSRIRHPKFCVECLALHGRHLRVWENLTHTHCHDHQVRLIDTCQHCNTKATWNNFSFKYCSSCYKAWPSQPKSDVPYYQTITPGSTEYRALIEAFVFTLRPYDLIFESIQMLDLNSEEINFHLMQAHYLLTSKNYRNNWFSPYNTFEIPHSEPFFSCIPLRGHLDRLADIYARFDNAHELIDEKFKEKVEIDDICTLPRLKLANSKEDLNAQLRIHAAAYFLEIDLNSLYYLEEQKVITCLKMTAMHRAKLFDIRNLNLVNTDLLSKCEPICTNQGSLISLAELSKKLPFFAISLGEFLYLLKSSEIPMYTFKLANKWTDIYMDFHMLTQWLESIYFDRLPHELTSAQIFSITSLRPQELLEVLYPEQNLPADQINKEHILGLFNKYIVLNNLSQLHEINVQDLKKMLVKNHLIAKHRIRQRTFLYEKTPLTLETIQHCINELKFM